MVLDQHLLSFWIRWLHVVSMAVLFGGLFLLLALVIDAKRLPHNDRIISAAKTYEWLFWLAIGIQVITGLGNIGSFGSGLAASSSP